MKTTDIKLTPGERYDVATLTHVGWTAGDGTGHDGYHVSDYFDHGKYLGPDCHGIEPTFSATTYYGDTAHHACPTSPHQATGMIRISKSEHAALCAVVEAAQGSLMVGRNRAQEKLRDTLATLAAIRNGGAQ